jgi:PPOX class probable F420-dependent enzyme
MDPLEQFAKKSYLNLETFRKSGEGVKTPVWFVREADALYINTGAASGKVKRIHNNANVNVVPCSMSGKPQGAWTPAVVRQIDDPAITQKVDRLLDKKYGLMRKLMAFRSQKRAAAILEVKLSAQ